MPANSKFSFSVVIPTYNEKEYLPLCLDSIINQNYDRDLVEIIVVDGLSTDGTLSVIKKYQSKHSGIKYFVNSEKKTPNALNIG
ncbi:MAG: glycosyltransferase family 2 protein, partial [Ignavibacteriae bacterium]